MLTIITGTVNDLRIFATAPLSLSDPSVFIQVYFSALLMS